MHHLWILTKELLTRTAAASSVAELRNGRTSWHTQAGSDIFCHNLQTTETIRPVISRNSKSFYLHSTVNLGHAHRGDVGLTVLTVLVLKVSVLVIRHCPTTAGQNIQLLWEKTDFDFTVGKCHVAYETSRVLDSYRMRYTANRWRQSLSVVGQCLI